MINKLIKNCYLLACCLLLWSQISSAHTYPQAAATKAGHIQSNADQAHTNNSKIISHDSLEHYASQVKQALPQAQKELLAKLGLSIPTVKIHLSSNKAKMLVLAAQHHRFTPPSWSAGLAYPRSQEIYLPEVPHNQLLPLLKHELVHIALGQHKRIPLWINEGIAVAIGEGLSWERLWTLHEATVQHSLLKFENLRNRFPHSGTQASIAYAQSAHFIAYLRETQSELNFKAWLSALLAGEHLEKASKHHLSHEFWFLERTWRKSLEKGWFAQIALLFKMETVWALSILFFVFAGLKKLRKRKQRLSSYDEQPLTVRIAPPSILKGVHKSENTPHNQAKRIFQFPSEL
ncbi:MAG: hypothetical protein CMH49_05510 [Myxococcales bacterium]|nr:hypothetical protein [Myxococcales bacterium]